MILRYIYTGRALEKMIMHKNGSHDETDDCNATCGDLGKLFGTEKFERLCTLSDMSMIDHRWALPSLR